MATEQATLGGDSVRAEPVERDVECGYVDGEVRARAYTATGHRADRKSGDSPPANRTEGGRCTEPAVVRVRTEGGVWAFACWHHARETWIDAAGVETW